MSVSDRLNPEFTKIAEHYHAQKQHRKSIENDKKGLFSHVKHLEQLNTSLRSQLNRKSTELKYLSAVRQRYLQDLKQKAENQQTSQQKLQALRQSCLKSKTDSLKNIQDALENMQRKKQRLTKQVKNTLSSLKQQYSLHRSRLDQHNQDLFREVESMKETGKQRINKFFRKQNTQLLHYFLREAEREKSLSEMSEHQIDTLKSQESKYQKKIDKRNIKLKKIAEQIEALRNTNAKCNTQMIHVPSEL